MLHCAMVYVVKDMLELTVFPVCTTKKTLQNHYFFYVVAHIMNFSIRFRSLILVFLVDNGYDHELAWTIPYGLICYSITQARVQIRASVIQK